MSCDVKRLSQCQTKSDVLMLKSDVMMAFEEF